MKQIDGLIVDEKNGEKEELEPKVLIYCASHIQAMQKTNKSNVTAWIPWPYFLDAVRWQYKSRVDQAVRQGRESFGCHSTFHKETKTRDFSPSII